MFCKKENAQKFKIPGGTKGWLYPSSPREDQTIALIEMDGIYPEKGYSLNEVCTETIFVIEGELEIEVGETKAILKENDLFMILPGKKYRTRGKAKALDLITPIWDKNQNHIVKA